MRLLLFLLFPSTVISAAEPTHRDIRYSEDFDRCTLDLWLPENSESAPLVVFFHGGAFIGGNKTLIPFRREIKRLGENGVALASVGYPLLGDTGSGGEIGSGEYGKILGYTERAVSVLRERAEEFGIDPERFVVGGVSAGALISQHLTYQTNKAITACIALEQPFETQRVIEAIDAGEPPLILYTGSGPDDFVHNPAYARLLKAHCDEVGVPCHLYGSEKSGLPMLPEGKSFLETALPIIFTTWTAGR